MIAWEVRRGEEEERGKRKIGRNGDDEDDGKGQVLAAT
jgi:hypothetical protein